MDFVFSHDGHTYAKYSECHDGQPTQVLFFEPQPANEEQQPLEPSGDTE